MALGWKFWEKQVSNKRGNLWKADMLLNENNKKTQNNILKEYNYVYVYILCCRTFK